MDFKTLLNGSGQTTSDFVAWLKTWGATSNGYMDAWREVLIANGYDSNSSHFEDMYMTWLESQTGFSRSDNMAVEDLENYAVTNGLYTFAPVAEIWDVNEIEPSDLDGSDIINIPSRIGSNTVTQSTGSQRPTLTTVNGKRRARFDDANSEFLSVSHIAALDFDEDPHSYIVVMATDDATASNRAVFDSGASGTSDGILCFIGTSEQIRTQSRNPSATIDSDGAVNDGNIKIIYYEFDGVTRKTYVNNILQTQTDTTVADLDGTGSPDFCIGARYNNGTEDFFYDGDFMQLQFYSNILQAGERTNAYNQLLSKWS